MNALVYSFGEEKPSTAADGPAINQSITGSIIQRDDGLVVRV